MEQHDIGGQPFTFEIDPARKLLTVTKYGYWSMATVEAFALALRANLRRMRAAGGCHHYLVDARDFAVQSIDVAEALQAMVESLGPDCPRRMAGVMGSQLGKLQARRTGETTHRRAFNSRAEAESWLLAADAPAPRETDSAPRRPAES